MNMNILEQENLIKGAPDEVLIEEAQAPSGNLPQFLIVSELQRRKQMRDRFMAQEQQPEQTISEQIVAKSVPQGIGALQQQASSMPMQAPQMPPEMMAAQTNPMAPQPQMIAAGGGRMPYRRMAGGGIVPPNSLVEDAAKFNPQTMYDMDASQMGMANPTNMGIASVLPMAAGGVVRMQQGEQVPFVSMDDNTTPYRRTSPLGVGPIRYYSDDHMPLIPFKHISPSEAARMSEEELGAYNLAVGNELAKRRSANILEKSGLGSANILEKSGLGGNLGQPGLEDSLSETLAKETKSLNVDDQQQNRPVMTISQLQELAGITPETGTAPETGTEKKEENAVSPPTSLLKTYMDKLEDYLGKKSKVPDYSELIDTASSTEDDKLATILTSLGASIASGEGFAKGAKEGLDKLTDMKKEERNAVTALRLAQLRGASEAEIADLTRDVSIAGAMLTAIPKPLTPQAQSELQKTLSDMRVLELQGKTDSQQYRLLQERANTISRESTSMSNVQAEYMKPILDTIAKEGYENLSPGQKRLYDDYVQLDFIQQMMLRGTSGAGSDNT
tara:strand:+ start:5137 stop:6813 length:1677 start_codon:yes stop_codon:yes gene_type:complete